MLRKNLITIGVLTAVTLSAWAFVWATETWRRSKFGRGWLILFATSIAALIVLLTLFLRADARDLGQWDAINNDPAVREWFKTLMRPDMPDSPCCGEADGYWCDDIHVTKGHTSCAITDDRPDEPRGRPHVAIGTVIEIPDEKLKWDRGNPTGHSIVFIGGGYANFRLVFCFVQSSGI